MLPAFEVAFSLLSGVPLVLFNIFVTVITLCCYVLTVFGIIAYTGTYAATVSDRSKTWDQAWNEVTSDKDGSPSPLMPLGIVGSFVMWVVLIFMTYDKYGGKTAFVWIHLQVLFVCVVVVSMVTLGIAGLILSCKALGRWSSVEEGQKTSREQTEIQMEEGVKLMENEGEVGDEEERETATDPVQESAVEK